MSKEHHSFDYAAEVAEHQTCSSKLRLHDLVDANLHHFMGFAAEGATLGLACDRIAGAVGCKPDSLRRVFLGKLGKWAEFRAANQKRANQPDAGAEPPHSSSDVAGETGFARVW